MDKEKKLNTEQKQAAEHKDGPILVVAGAGTGKTTVLVERLNFLVKNNLAKADEVLLVTFTEKAAAEMENRALEILPYGFVDLWIDTFHKICERILREHALDIGLSSDFKIFSQTDQWVLIRKNLDKFNLDYYRPLGNPTKFISELIRHFSRLKDEDISPKEYLAFALELKQNQDAMLSGAECDDEMEAARLEELANAYHVYNQLLLESSALDFGDLISYTIKLFKERPNILKIYQDKFKYIMVDEFQDTNWAQYELIKVLSARANNLMVVGDDDQSIYRFRGASMSNIMQFKDDYPKAEQVILTKNYRSGQEILDASYEFISHNNPHRLEKKLKIKKKLSSEINTKSEVSHHHLGNEYEEMRFVAANIIELKKEKNWNWSDFAILSRSNDTAEKFSQELTRQSIPNQFVSLKGLFRKGLILDVIAYFKLLDDYHESSALFRILNMAPFKIEHKDLIILTNFSRKKYWSLFETIKNISAVPGLSPESVAKAKKLFSLIEKHSALARDLKPSKMFVNFVYESDLLLDKDFDEDYEFFSLLNQFYEKIKKFELASSDDVRLSDFLALLEMEQDSGDTGSLRIDFDDDDKVKVMTVHASKGLEYKCVFMVDLEDKRFPTISRKEKIAVPIEILKEKTIKGKEEHIEEERRLFYVAITRAKERLFLVSAADCGGVKEKKPSVFIEEAGVKLGECENKKNSSNELLEDLAIFASPIIWPKMKYPLPDKFSFSQIEAYANCPLQYKFNFILKIPVPQKAVMTFGRVMHNTLRDFFAQTMSSNGKQAKLFTEGVKKASEISLKELLVMYKNNWVEEGYANAKERDDYKKKGEAMLKIFYNSLSQDNYPDILFLEKPFIARISGIFFRGAIDRIDQLPDGTVEVIDYKTGNPKDKLTYENKRQLILYKIAIEEGLGIKVSKLSFYYFDNGKKVSFSAKDEEIEKLKLDIKETVAKIFEGDFSPTPSMLCDFCDFKGICEFKKKN